MSSELAEMQRQAELEAYRRRFEEAMIRIEDQEDVEAFNEAKAEIDDEFDEIEGGAAIEGGQPSTAGPVSRATVSEVADEDGVREAADEVQEEGVADAGVKQIEGQQASTMQDNLNPEAGG